MGISYTPAPEWTARASEIAKRTPQLAHVDTNRIACVKSKGSRARRTIARIHTLGKVMQLGMDHPAFYTIELVSEQFDRQSEQEQVKTIIHELLHIPHTFGGGFRHHRPHVNHRTVEAAWKAYQKSGTQEWTLHQ